MATGKLKFFNVTRGYGFITPDEAGPDVFVHITAFERAGITEVTESGRISYGIVIDERSGRPRANNITLPTTTN